jgi:DNA-binding MarR family transcriptional regulator
MEKDNEEIFTSLRKIIRAIDLESKQIQKNYGLSIPQLLCLNFLQQKVEYQATHKEIASQLNLNSSTITGIIDRLEHKGFVARLPKKGDKRITFISLSSKGEKMLKNVPDLMHQSLMKNLEKAPESEIQKIKTGLQLLVDYLNLLDMNVAPLLTDELL